MSRVPDFNPPRQTQSGDEFAEYQKERRKHGLKTPKYKKPKERTPEEEMDRLFLSFTQRELNDASEH